MTFRGRWPCSARSVLKSAIEFNDMAYGIGSVDYSGPILFYALSAGVCFIGSTDTEGSSLERGRERSNDCLHLSHAKHHIQDFQNLFLD